LIIENIEVGKYQIFVINYLKIWDLKIFKTYFILNLGTVRNERKKVNLIEDHNP